MNKPLAGLIAWIFASGSVHATSLDSEFYALARTRDLAGLTALARSRLAANPNDDVALWHLGRAVAQDATQRDALIPHAERCVKEVPRSARCHNVLGNLLASAAAAGGLSAGLKHGGRIKQLYADAVTLDPARLSFRRDLVRYYLLTPRLFGGSVGKAEQICEDMAKRSPPRGKLLRAEIQIHEEEFEAAEALLATIEAGSDFELLEAVLEASANLGLALVDDDRAAHAQQLFERLAARDPGFAMAQFGLGRALLAQESWDAAIGAFTKALALDPRSRVHYRLGVAYQAKGDHPRAIEMFREFLRYASHAPQADDARERLAKLERNRAGPSP